MYMIYSLNNGGAEMLALKLAEAINTDHFNVLICSLSDAGPLREILEKKNIDFLTLGKKEGKDLTIVRKLTKVLNNYNIDIVHTHNQGPLLYMYLARFFQNNCLLVHTEHINMNKEHSYQKKHLIYNRILYRKINGFVSVAEHLTRDLKTHYGLRKAKVDTIRNCVASNTAQIIPGVSLREELGVSKDTFIIGNISALRKQKDHTTLLKAMEQLNTKYPNTILVIAGDGELKNELQSKAKELGLEKAIYFLGYRSDVNELLSQFDIFVLPSLYEGLPLCILEAMSAARPIVATNADGTNELIEDETTGLLVPLSDHVQLAAALERLIEDADLAKALGKNAKEHVKAKYSMDEMILSYELYYKELLEESSK